MTGLLHGLSDSPIPVIGGLGALIRNVKIAWRVSLGHGHGIRFLLHVWGRPASGRGGVHVPSLRALPSLCTPPHALCCVFPPSFFKKISFRIPFQVFGGKFSCSEQLASQLILQE